MPLGPVLLCLTLLAGMLAATRQSAPQATAPAIDEAPIAAWILHVETGLAERAMPAYADLVSALPGSVELIIACGAGVDGKGLCAALGIAPANGRAITLLDGGAQLSPWARDRYLVFPHSGANRILLPRAESVSDAVAGDCNVARQIAETDPDLELVECELAIEGGDVVLCEGTVLVGVRTVLGNADRYEDGTTGVEARLEELFDRRVVVVGEGEGAVPHEHLDMYLSALGSRHLLLGDPRLARDFFDKRAELAIAGPETDVLGICSWETQAEAAPLYDDLARQLEAAGFSVERLPILHTDEGELITWNNAVTERRGAHRYAYVPAYGVPLLDELALRAWRHAGYEVKPIRCAQVIREGGALRCLTNVLRSPPEPPLDQPPVPGR